MEDSKTTLFCHEKTEADGGMKALLESERPYEKCQRAGAEHLTDAELLAILLQTGTKKASAIELARSLLGSVSEQNLLGLSRLNFSELTAFSGIGRVKAIKILAVLEISNRIARQSFGTKPVFDCPSAIADYYMQSMRVLDVEKVYVLFFDTKCRFLGDKLLSVGTVNASLISPREIFIEALRRQAVHIILLHNHPSGNPAASREDVAITVQVAEAAKILEISLMDHIIIGDNRYFSFRESNYAPFGAGGFQGS